MTDAAETQAQDNTVELKNYDPGHPKWVYDEGGKRYDLPPLARDRFEQPIARLFTEQYPAWVREYEEKTIPVREGEQTVYIANVTGSRLLPPTVKVMRRVDGEDREVEIENPMRTPMVLEHKLQGTQTITGPDDNRKSRKEMPLNVTLEPLKRYAMPWGVADTIMNRDMRAPKNLLGRVIRVDPPSPCEPNDSWPLDEIRAWAFIVDPKHFSKKRLTAQFPSEKAHCRAGKQDPDENEIRKTKKALLDELFPCIIDSRFPKPQSTKIFDKIKADVLTELDVPRKAGK